MQFTSEQVQSYIRIAIYWLAGFAVNYGFVASDKKTAVVGAAVTAANLVWTYFGSSLVARLNEIAKYDAVTKIVVTTKELEHDTPSTKIATEVK